MKLILAFDSYKNCLSSPDICRILSESILAVQPDWQITSLPLGDGGEGTAQAVVSAANGTMHKYTVRGPLGRKVEAQWGELPGGSAIFEMATASGIELVARKELDPMKASTYGTGELLRHLACEKNIRQFTIGIGGSATVDGGIGMLQALGVEFYDQNNDLIPSPAGGGALAQIARIDVSKIPDAIRKSSIKVASDVTNPLCGATGAARVFAPQKGADPAMVEVLEDSLYKFGRLSIRQGFAQSIDNPGDGAAGGLGFALRNYLNAELTSGAELVVNVLDFDRIAADADWVITGEGCSDFQTAHGKLCSIVARHAHRSNVPVILLSGALGEKADELEDVFEAVLALSSRPATLDEALSATPENLQRMGKALANILKAKV